MPVICNSCFDKAESELENTGFEALEELVGAELVHDIHHVRTVFADILKGKFMNINEPLIWSGDRFMCIDCFTTFHYLTPPPEVVEMLPDDEAEDPF